MFVLLVVAVTAVTVTYSKKPYLKVACVRLITDTSPPTYAGFLKLTENIRNKSVCITGTVRGLTNGYHGIHVHTKGNMITGCTSTGPHFNPKNVNHGGPNDTKKHAGDLGNILSSGGIAKVNKTSNTISLNGLYSILGRSIVVHSGRDDLGKGNNTNSLKNGNSGIPWACGVIGID